MTLLYIVGDRCEWGDHEDLRFSLRSAEKFLAHDNVVISGHLPKWCAGVDHVPGDDFSPLRDVNIQTKLLRALKSGKVGERFAMMCDDIYLLEPYTDLRTRERGNLWDTMEALRNRPESDQFRRVIENTLECLALMGVEEPLNFGTHHPVIMERDKCIETVQYSLGSPRQVCVSTLYHYMHGSETTKGHQAKQNAWRGGFKGPVLSSSEHVERNHAFKEFLVHRFPRVSKYEKIA